MKSNRKARADGGPNKGVDDADKDETKKNMRYTADSNVNEEAEERKKGGRAKRKAGGFAAAPAKSVGTIGGTAAQPNAGRAPRKSGGRTGSPFSAAHAGPMAKGRKGIEPN